MVKFPKDVKRIVSALNAEKFEAYVTGECIVEYMAGQTPVGWDIATDAGLSDMMRIFPEGNVLSEKNSTVRFEFIEEIVENDQVVAEEGIIVDLHTYRSAENALGGVAGNTEGAAVTIEDDLMRAAFTCDAIADNGMRVVDPADGLTDARKKIIRTIGEPDKVFAANPVQIMRALAMAGKYGMSIGKDEFESMKANVNGLRTVAPARIGELFTDMLSGVTAGKALNLAIQAGILKFILTERVAKQLSFREKSDLTMLCKTIDNTKQVPERRLGLFYSVMSKKKALTSLDLMNYDEPYNTYLRDAVNDMAEFYFCTRPDAMKKFIYKHETMDRLDYVLNLEKAQRIAFDWDLEMKIKSQMYTLETIRNSGEPVFKEDLCIDAGDIIRAGITKDPKEADELLGWVTEHMHVIPSEHNKANCLMYAEKYKKNPVARKFRAVLWMK